MRAKIWCEKARVRLAFWLQKPKSGWASAYTNNEAISIDIEPVITKVQSMQSKIERAEKFDMQKFESELDSLCVEAEN